MRHVYLKKGISLLGAVLLTAACLSGCGTDKDQANGTKTVTVWTNSTHTKKVAEEMVAEYNNGRGKEKNIRIEYTVQGGDYQKVLEVSAQSGQLPDLFYAIDGVQKSADQNRLTAIEDMPGGAEFLESYKDSLTPLINVYNGKTYTVPYNLTTIGLIYNKELLKRNGLVDEAGEAKPPKTWNEVAEYAKICTDPENKISGIALPLKWGGYTSWEFLQPFFSSLGTLGYDFDNHTYNYSEFKPAFEWLAKIKADNSYFPGAEGLDNDPARAQFAEGRIAMKLAASWDVGVLNEQFPATFDWGVAPVPSLDDTPTYKQWCSGDAWVAISSAVKEENKEAVMDVYRWFHEDDFLVKMYETGSLIPFDASIIKKADTVTAGKGWKEFCAFADCSVILPSSPTIAVEGDKMSDIVSKFWAGDISMSNINEALKDLDTRSAEALKKEVDRGTITDFSLYEWGNKERYNKGE